MSKRWCHFGKKKIIAGSVGIVLLTSLCIISYALAQSRLIVEEENEFHPAEINIAVQENDTENTDSSVETELYWKNEGDTSTAAKIVQIKNMNLTEENNADAYIRVCLIPRWRSILTVSESDYTSTETADTAAEEGSVTTATIEADITGSMLGVEDFGSPASITIEGNTYKMGDVTFTLAEDWQDNWIFNSKDGYFYYRKPVAPDDSTEPLLESVSIPSSILSQLNDINVYLQVDVLADSIQTEGGALDARWKDAKINIVTSAGSEAGWLETATTTTAAVTTAT